MIDELYCRDGGRAEVRDGFTINEAAVGITPCYNVPVDLLFQGKGYKMGCLRLSPRFSGARAAGDAVV